jgi:predicted RNase H-like HicB family nuclease
MRSSPEPMRYRICIHHARDGFYARAVDVPGCVARGATEVEAVENLREAIRAFVYVARLLARDRPVLHLEITA